MALWGKGLEKGQWPLLALMPDTSVPPFRPLVPFKLLTQCWSSEGGCLSRHGMNWPPGEDISSLPLGQREAGMDLPFAWREKVLMKGAKLQDTMKEDTGGLSLGACSALALGEGSCVYCGGHPQVAAIREHQLTPFSSSDPSSSTTELQQWKQPLCCRLCIYCILLVFTARLARQHYGPHFTDEDTEA